MDESKGTILRVDLSSGRIEQEPLSERMRADYIGGRGINSRLLFDEVGPQTGPLSPQNRLVFGAGPFSGTAAPCIARFTVTGRSPLTGIHGDANAGGRFGPALKRAGLDHIVFEGASDKPVYLWIDNDCVELRSAEHLWGKNTRETENILKDRHQDRRVRVASIGPAGEHLVKFASITHEERSASRTGMGAVMGSKKLKAVAVRGTKTVPLHDPARFNRLAKELFQKMSAAPEFARFRAEGQSAGTFLTDKVGFLAIKNFKQAGGFEGLENFDPAAVKATYYTGSRGCYNCPIKCSKKFEVPEGPYAGEKGEKTEEGAWTPYGPVIGNAYIPAIFKLNNMGNQLGVDHIEFGQAMAVVMDWYERGIVTKADLDGIEMTWGNYQAVEQMMRKVAEREGVGAILADGIVRASRTFGKEAEACVSHSKGMVMAGIDCRMAKGLSLCFATSTRGADHVRGMPMAEFSSLIPQMKVMSDDDAEALFGSREALTHTSYIKGAMAVHYQHESLVMDMLEYCRFVKFAPHIVTPQALCDLYTHATGIEADVEFMRQAAERVYNVERAFGVMMGMDRADDVLVGKWADEPVPTGPHKGESIDPGKWQEMLDDYYQARGWDRRGIPTPQKLMELGLADISDKLDRCRNA